MKPLVSLLACLLPFSASAQQPPSAAQAPKSVDGKAVADPAAPKAPRPYYKMARKAAWEGDAIGRISLIVPDEISVDGAYGLCMVPPSADWVLDSKDPTLEEKYLRLLAVASALDQNLGGRGNGGSWTGSGCLEITRYEPESYPATLTASFDKWCPYDGGWAKPGVTARFAYTRDGNRISGRGVWGAVVDSVKALLESDHEATVLKALDTAKYYALPGSSPFSPSVAKLVIDSKRSAAVRKKAMSTLAGLDQSLLTAKTLVSIWQDTKNSVDVRIAALNAFGFVVQYHDSQTHLSKSGDKPHAPQFKAELKELIATNVSERDDFEAQAKKEANATNTPLGSAAYCVGSVFPKPLRDEVMGRTPGK
jgi:hypothetical protein